jgi:hypothetical protein
MYFTDRLGEVRSPVTVPVLPRFRLKQLRAHFAQTIRLSIGIAKSIIAVSLNWLFYLNYDSMFTHFAVSEDPWILSKDNVYDMKQRRIVGDYK